MLVLLLKFQELYEGDGSVSDGLVRYYSNNHKAFWADFAVSMIKMGNIKPLTTIMEKSGRIVKELTKINVDLGFLIY